MTSANKNWLGGMQCPKCGALEPFDIQVEATATVYDDGVNEAQDYTWDNDSLCYCPSCRHYGSVRHFLAGGAQ
jgi:hypothetical protein